jgi:hypothetical protein
MVSTVKNKSKVLKIQKNKEQKQITKNALGEPRAENLMQRDGIMHWIWWFCQIKHQFST